MVQQQYARLEVYGVLIEGFQCQAQGERTATWRTFICLQISKTYTCPLRLNQRLFFYWKGFVHRLNQQISENFVIWSAILPSSHFSGWFFEEREVLISSPMAGVIAKLILRHKELSLASTLEKEYTLYVRYVDDIFLISAYRTQLCN